MEARTNKFKGKESNHENQDEREGGHQEQVIMTDMSHIAIRVSINQKTNPKAASEGGFDFFHTSAMPDSQAKLF
jgi:hypothetical protein